MRTLLPLIVVLLTATAALADHTGPSTADEIGVAVAGCILFVFPVALLAFMIGMAVWHTFRRKRNRPTDVIDLTRTAPPPGT